ncbi:helix-turn-helix domain-containing protein [Actinokineospora sp. 24-640]
MSFDDPVVAQIQLGLLLRSLRTACDVSTLAAGKAIGTSNATISRVETGKQGIRPTDLINLLDFYEAGESTVAEALRLSSARTTGTRRRGSRDGGPYWFRRYLAMEDEATHLSVYENEVVTDLLQTDAYARVLAQAGTPVAGRAEIDRQVGQRMSRRRVLTRCDRAPAHLDVIMLESVLHRVIGDDETMAGQLRALLEFSRLPNVELRVLPFRPAPTPNNDESFVVRSTFTLLRLPEQGTRLYREDLTGAVYPEDLAVIEQHSHAFQRLRAAAADQEAARVMIGTVLKEYE